MTIDASSLKLILSNLRTPDRLDEHPWARSLIVQDAVKSDPDLAQKSPGAQLVRTLANVFRETMPPTPPHDGKRVDTRWGRFGILASNYFAPLVFGRLYPRSLLEAWRRIDASILLFVYGKTSEHLAPEQVNAYRLVGDELAFPASSTISDWHRQGIDELAQLLATRERALSEAHKKPSPVLEGPAPDGRSRTNWARRAAILALLLALLTALGIAALKGYRINQRLRAVREDLSQLQGLQLASFQPSTIDRAGPLLKQTDDDIASLRAEVEPWLPLAGSLRWVPVYGGDLSTAPNLLELAACSVGAARQTYSAVAPIWVELHGAKNLKAADLTQMLLDVQPKLIQAQATLGEARQARQEVDTDRLSPTTRRLVERLDPYLSSLDESLSLAREVPALLGAAESGPKTYLILVENEDELRPTGGFITAVGKAVVWKGQLLDLKIEDSSEIDDPEKAYPAAPWQMQQFMNIPIMVFRDTSWFTDYPTAVSWAEYLYAYTNSYSVDGVIAVDQNFMATLLSVTGPVDVPEIHTTITAGNLRTVMRAQKVPPPPDQQDPNWYRKQFMNPMAAAILRRLMSGQEISWEALLRAVVASLDRHDVLVQLDNPTIAQLLAERGWNGAVRRDGGDFLMVVDTNVGYNKTNAVVTPTISYDVNLSDPNAATSSLVVSYTNNANPVSAGCNQYPTDPGGALLEPWYPMDRCYYDYVRIYLPAGAQYQNGVPQAVTRDEMVMLEEDVPPRVDVLEEDIANVQAFGTLLVVPIGKTVQMGLEFKLPSGIVQTVPETGNKVYHLKIQKQAGQPAIPLTLRVHLPGGSSVRSANQEFIQSGPDLLFNLSLSTDIDIRIEFQP